MDALELLDKLVYELPNKTLIYLDPPYYNKGSLLYKNHYKAEDHIKIADKIACLNYPWLITYDNCEPVRFLYRNFDAVEYSGLPPLK